MDRAKWSYLLATVAVLVTLLGCIASTGVFETGKDTYTIAETGGEISIPLGELQKSAYQRANGG